MATSGRLPGAFLEISQVAKFLLRWVSLASLGILLVLWALRYPAAEAPPPPPLPAATPMTMANPVMNPVRSGEQPAQEKLLTKPPPPSKPARQVLKVAPPPVQAPVPPVAEAPPQLPGPSYPTAGRPPDPLPPPPQAYLEAPRASSPRLSAGQYVQRAEAASAQIDRLIRRGKLQAQFVGTGHAGAMVEMALENISNQTLTLHLAPGMILRPPDGQQVQPLMVDEEATLTLAPGGSAYRQLQSYCMDSRVPAPFAYEPIDYRFAPRTRDGGSETVRVFQAAQELNIQNRHAVTQIAIWKSLRQPVDDDRLRSAMGAAFHDPNLRQQILRDVQRVLQAAR